jgi:hypothetical protein
MRLWDPERWQLVTHLSRMGTAFAATEDDSRWLIHLEPLDQSNASLEWHPQEEIRSFGLLSSRQIQGSLRDGAKIAEWHTGQSFRVHGTRKVRLVAPGADLVVYQELGSPPAPFVVVGVALEDRGRFVLPFHSRELGFQVRLRDLLITSGLGVDHRVLKARHIDYPGNNNVIRMADRERHRSIPYENSPSRR